MIIWAQAAGRGTLVATRHSDRRICIGQSSRTVTLRADDITCNLTAHQKHQMRKLLNVQHRFEHAWSAKEIADLESLFHSGRAILLLMHSHSISALATFAVASETRKILMTHWLWACRRHTRWTGGQLPWVYSSKEPCLAWKLELTCVCARLLALFLQLLLI